MDYEKLEEANAKLVRTDIKGKEYVEVSQRIQCFWRLFPEGRIITEVLMDDGERCTFKATCYDGERIVSTGHAYEVMSGGMVNRTSYMENCETSAVGRALGILGIGSTESIASAEEVSSAAASAGTAPRKPSKWPATGRCRSCGSTCEFVSAEQFGQYRQSLSCCPSPNYEVS